LLFNVIISNNVRLKAESIN